MQRLLLYLLILFYASTLSSSQEDFEFRVLRPTFGNNNLLTFECSDNLGEPVDDPDFFRNGDRISVTPAPGDIFVFAINRSSEGVFACGRSSPFGVAMSISQTLVSKYEFQ